MYHFYQHKGFFYFINTINKYSFVDRHALVVLSLIWVDSLKSSIFIAYLVIIIIIFKNNLCYFIYGLKGFEQLLKT